MLVVATVWILMGVIMDQRSYAAGYEIDSGICGIRKVSPDLGRIVGGSTSQPGSWPWQVMMQSNGVRLCGAVLISEEYLLTAAHCVFSDRKDFSFHLGAHRVDASDDTAIEVQVHVMICHPNFDRPINSYANDICLVKLATPTTFTDYIRPVCLPKEGSRVAVGERVTITGWGKTKNTGSMEYLNEAEVLVINTTTCKSWYDSLQWASAIPDSHFCAGYQSGGIDTCEGDSGGPLVHEEHSGNVTAYVLRGITSFGYYCALEEMPGVYVRVSDMIPWIENKMKDLSAPVCQATKSDTCGGNISSDTVIRSPTSTDTFDYPPNQDCTWNVTAPAGFQIHVTFLCYFLLSPPESGGEDYLIITSSEGNKFFWGNGLPSPYIVDSGNASITFVTDNTLNYPGFVANITFVKSNTTSTTPSAGSHDHSSVRTTEDNFSGDSMNQTDAPQLTVTTSSVTTTEDEFSGDTMQHTDAPITVTTSSGSSPKAAAFTFFILVILLMKI